MVRQVQVVNAGLLILYKLILCIVHGRGFYQIQFYVLVLETPSLFRQALLYIKRLFAPSPWDPSHNLDVIYTHHDLVEAPTRGKKRSPSQCVVTWPHRPNFLVQRLLGIFAQHGQAPLDQLLLNDLPSPDFLLLVHGCLASRQDHDIRPQRLEFSSWLCSRLAAVDIS